MELLQPDWNQKKPTLNDVRQMLASLRVEVVALQTPLFDELLQKLRAGHIHGGAYLFCYSFGPSKVFDWYASRNRWSFDCVVDSILAHPTILESLKIIDAPQTPEIGFAMDDSFLADGRIARLLYNGGAYGSPKGNGTEEKQFALKVCDAMFDGRFGEVHCEISYKAWTPWFMGIAWDLTLMLFDKRLRQLWLLVVTDTD